MTLSFGKGYRLLKPKDFDGLKLNSKKKKHGPLVVYFKRREEGFSRIAISVPSKFYNSVQRNKIKRVIREHFRKNPIKSSSIDILFVMVEKTKKENFLIMIADLSNSLDFLTSHISKTVKTSLLNDE